VTPGLPSSWVSRSLCLPGRGWGNQCGRVNSHSLPLTHSHMDGTSGPTLLRIHNPPVGFFTPRRDPGGGANQRPLPSWAQMSIYGNNHSLPTSGVQFMQR